MSVRINIVGAPGMGKSSFIQRHFNGEFPAQSWLPSVVNIDFYTTKGWVSVEFQENGNRSSDFTVLFVDSPDNLQETVDKYKPDLICYNKVDLKKPPVNIWNVKKSGIMFYYLSSKSNYNYEKPILAALQKVFGKDTYIIPEPGMRAENYILPSTA